jgi:hypothetical protein
MRERQGKYLKLLKRSLGGLLPSDLIDEEHVETRREAYVKQGDMCKITGWGSGREA